MQSLIALQVLGSMGLNVAVIHYISNQISTVEFSAGQITGPKPRVDEIFFVLRYSLKWYLVASFAVLIILIPLGCLFFEANQTEQISAIKAWSVLCVSTALNFILVWLLTILDGFDKVELASKYRLIQLFVAYPLTWFFLYLGWGLVAFGIGQLIGVLVTTIVVVRFLHPLLLDFKTFWQRNSNVNWTAPFWDFQWRIALSWICGLFIFSILSPILLIYSGAVAAGQFGLALHIFRSLAAVSNSFMEVRQPLLGKMIAQNMTSDLDRVYKQTLGISLSSFFLLGLFALFAIGQLIIHTDLLFGRLPSMPLLFMMFLVGVTYLIRMSQATYTRAHKTEPFLKVEIVCALSTFLCAVTLIPKFGLSGAVVAYFLGSACFGLFAGVFVFRRFRMAKGYQPLFRRD